MALREPNEADYKLVKERLDNFKSDRAGHGGLLLTRLFVIQSDLKGGMPARDEGKIVLEKLCKPLMAEGDHATYIKAMASGNNTDKFILRNFRLITEVLMEVMDKEKCLYDIGQKRALERVMECVIKCITIYFKE
ncbi:myoglobin-like [Carassius carassius]|uniref:myoglobin-like n=1 Tax=Carassius carassius TaxID=217509 RepID=UPI0028689E2F|nr:myoglobin-like [Carassius carassius]